MYLDISRSRFDPAKHYSAVLLQQGRVVLDSDAWEQTAIAQYYLRTALTDIIGQAGCPSGNAGFGITGPITTNGQQDLTVSAGRCYVDGILAEAVQPVVGGTPQDITYLTQPDGYLDPAGYKDDGLPTNTPYIVYLRVWERSVSALQDPDIREVALGIHGPDTSGRAQVVWQVSYLTVHAQDAEDAYAAWQDWLRGLYRPAGTLAARAQQPAGAATDICSVAPQAQYRGPENQNYLVEILQDATSSQPARYSWQRDAGSVAFPIASLAGAEVTFATLGRDLRSGLEIGDHVEIADDASASRVADELPARYPRTLFQVTAIDAVNRIVTLDSDPTTAIGATGTDPTRHPLLRRWDSALVPVTEGQWLPIEDGVEVFFPGSQVAGTSAKYRPGNYWLIPARTVLADVIWPQDDSGPKALPPAGVAYHYVPLAYVPLEISNANPIFDMRPKFDPRAQLPAFT